MNVLVTGVGAIIGYGIIESLRLSQVDCFIVGIDIFEENYGKYMGNEFVQAPFTSDRGYSGFIQDLIQRFKIDIIFPGIEQDMLYYSDNRNAFDVSIVLNDRSLISFSQDKYLMYRHLQEKEFEYLIPTFQNLSFGDAQNTLGMPFIIKPRKSYASKGYFVINDEATFNNCSEWVNENTIFQPYVGDEDQEYTASIFGDAKGGFYDGIIFRRYLAKSGASDKVEVCDISSEERIFFERIAQIFKPIGPTNIQYRKSKGKIYLLEINPRLSSSGSLRTKFGYNEPELCLKYFGNHQRDFRPSVKLKGKAVRYIADKIIYE